ncbi:MAG: hypothetical protein AAF941_08425 [Pseudomonadota bacterium]
MSSASDPASCDRDADGQTACLAQTFKADACNEASVLGSMFRENEKEGTYSHRTAFGVDSACVAQIRAAAPKRRLREDGRGAFVLDREDGYRETLTIGLQISQNGSVVEWERAKE